MLSPIFRRWSKTKLQKATKSSRGFQAVEETSAGSVLWEFDLTAGLPLVPDWLAVRLPVGAR